jgi:putative ABC transport system substrate-binding protein
MQATPDIDAKRLQLLKDAVPKLSRVAFLGLKSDWDNVNGQAVRAGARKLGVTLVLAEHTRTNYADALASIDKDRPDAVFVPIQPASYANRKVIFDFMLAHKLPASYPWRQFVDAGGLMSYGANLPDLFRRAAGYVDRILKGAKPGDLPIEQASKFELVLNLKAAKAIGLELPPLLIAQAEEVVE